MPMTNNVTEPTMPDGPEVAIVVHYQAMAGKGGEASPHFEGIAVAQIRPLLSERTLRFCQVVEPDG